VASDPRRKLIPVRRLLVLFPALALAAAACSGGGSSRELGRAGDTVISMSDVDVLYDADSIPIDDTFRQTLFRLLAVEIIEQSLEDDYGVTIDDTEVDARFVDLKSQVDFQGITVAEALGIPDAGDEMLRFNARLEIILDAAVDALLSDETFLREFSADEAAVTEVCARHILVATEDEANDAVSRIEAGEDFAAVATEISIDTGSGAQGGDLGCGPASQYVEPFAEATIDAALGELVGPVESRFGFHLIIVDSRSVPTFEEIAADPQSYIPAAVAQGEFQTWFNDSLDGADVSVSEEYGTWSPQGIIPPGDAEE
jgi:parvulin-like peptidyl-prolyl isomerase